MRLSKKRVQEELQSLHSRVNELKVMTPDQIDVETKRVFPIYVSQTGNTVELVCWLVNDAIERTFQGFDVHDKKPILAGDSPERSLP